MASLRIDLSQCLLSQNRLSEAKALAIEARNDVIRDLGPQHPLTKSATENLNAIYEKQGKHDSGMH